MSLTETIDKIKWTPSILYVSSRIADDISTIICVEKFGVDIELNPVHKFFMKNLGNIGLLGSEGLFAGYIFLASHLSKKFLDANPRLAVYYATGFSFAYAIHNTLGYWYYN